MTIKLGGCCDACGVSGQNWEDEILCRMCWLKNRLAEAKKKDWMRQYHMIQGMITDLRNEQ